jgi:hypothetical protein
MFSKVTLRPPLEMILSASPKHLERKFDEKSGIALIRIEPSELQ